jgi:GNAT superfamily N-acetyltransferase
MNQINIISVTSKNVSEEGVFCIKNKEALGSQAKVEWCKRKGNEELQLKIAVNAHNKQIGFIEYIPAELAWRPIEANNYLFIHCIAIFVKEARNKNVGSSLIKACEQEARHLNKLGVCVVTSKGAWMVDKKLFEKNGYYKVDELDRFELMAKKFDPKRISPRLINWKKQQKKYKGWNLIYADQCPWHTKSVSDLKELASEYDINLKVKKIKNSIEAKKSPSGFGVYSLIRDGKLIEDHYLSKTRFKNILKAELQ